MEAEQADRVVCHKGRDVYTPAVLGKGAAPLAGKQVVAEAGFEGGRRGRVGV